MSIGSQMTSPGKTDMDASLHWHDEEGAYRSTSTALPAGIRRMNRGA